MRDLGVARSDKRHLRDKGKQENRQRSCATKENKLVQAGRQRNRREAGGIFDLWKLTRADCAKNRRKNRETGKLFKQWNEKGALARNRERQENKKTEKEAAGGIL